MIIGALLTSLTLAREWEMGTMEQLLSTPLRPAEIALGKMSAYFVLGLIDMLLTIVVGVGIFQVPQRGSYVFLVVTGCLFLIGALFWGILISALYALSAGRIPAGNGHILSSRLSAVGLCIRHREHAAARSRSSPICFRPGISSRSSRGSFCAVSGSRCSIWK